MNKLVPVFTVIALVVAAPTSVVADSVDLPHSFQSGAPASAAEVNANFDAVKTAIDDNSADIAVLREGAAAIEADIAALQQTAAAAIGGVSVAVEGTPVGTLLSVNPRVGRPSDPNAPDPEASVLYPASIYDTPALWILNGRGYVARKVRSRTNDGADCVELATLRSVPARRVLPNDPAVSGIPNDLVGRVTLRTN